MVLMNFFNAKKKVIEIYIWIFNNADTYQNGRQREIERESMVSEFGYLGESKKHWLKWNKLVIWNGWARAFMLALCSIYVHMNSLRANIKQRCNPPIDNVHKRRIRGEVCAQKERERAMEFEQIKI